MSSVAVQEIVLNLGDQVRLYHRLLDLAQAQLAALQQQDVRLVHAILQEIEMVMLDRSKVEQRRGVAINTVAAELGIPSDEITASLLQGIADVPLAQALESASAKLRGLVKELDVVVGKNRVLLEHELAVIDHMVKGMTAVPAANATYGKTGAQHELPRLKILDAQV